MDWNTFLLNKKVICVTNFSVPQARKRIYIVAFRNDLEVEKFVFPKGKGRLKSISDILEDNVDVRYEIFFRYSEGEIPFTFLKILLKYSGLS